MHLAIVAEPHLVMGKAPDPHLNALCHRRAFWDEIAPQVADLDHAWGMARDGLEDIGTLRSIRHPRGRETWNHLVREEKRLFAQIDGVLAGGSEVLKLALESVLRESEIPPDPEWIFAVSLVLACDGSAGAGDSVLAIFRRACTLEPVCAEAASEALSLAPGENVGPPLRFLISKGTFTEISRAAQVLSQRRGLDEANVCSLLNSENPACLVPALDAAVDCGYESALQRVPEFYSHKDEAVARSALRAAFAARLPGARERAIELCHESPEFAEAVMCLGLFGVLSDLAIFHDLCGVKNFSTALRASGYWGYPEIIPVLLEVIRRGDETLIFPAADAFERITGAGLYTRPDPDEEPRIDAGLFEQWWRNHRAGFLAGARHRRGEFFSAATLIDELEHIPMDHEDRWLVHLQLTSLSPLPPPPFRPWDFISRQRSSIDLWQERFGFRPK